MHVVVAFFLLISTLVCAALHSDPIGACCFEEAGEQFCYLLDHVRCSVSFGGSWYKDKTCSDVGIDCLACELDVTNEEVPCDWRVCWTEDGSIRGSCAFDKSQAACVCMNVSDSDDSDPD